jgi:hypothetical protein
VLGNQRASSHEDVAARLLLSTLPAICHRVSILGSPSLRSGTPGYITGFNSSSP